MHTTFLTHVKREYGKKIADQVRKNSKHSSHSMVALLARALSGKFKRSRMTRPFDSVPVPTKFDVKKMRRP